MASVSTNLVVLRKEKKKKGVSKSSDQAPYSEVPYIKKCMKNCLPLALHDVCLLRPADPIEFLAHWLYKHVDCELYFLEKAIFQRECQLMRLQLAKARARRLANIRDLNEQVQMIKMLLLSDKVQLETLWKMMAGQALKRSQAAKGERDELERAETELQNMMASMGEEGHRRHRKGRDLDEDAVRRRKSRGLDEDGERSRRKGLGLDKDGKGRYREDGELDKYGKRKGRRHGAGSGSSSSSYSSSSSDGGYGHRFGDTDVGMTASEKDLAERLTHASPSEYDRLIQEKQERDMLKSEGRLEEKGIFHKPKHKKRFSTGSVLYGGTRRDSLVMCQWFLLKPNVLLCLHPILGTMRSHLPRLPSPLEDPEYWRKKKFDCHVHYDHEIYVVCDFEDVSGESDDEGRNDDIDQPDVTTSDTSNTLDDVANLS